ncbi:MAG: asparaginase [Anaerolineales bacterium]
MSASAYQPIYALSRGRHQESLHYGAMAVVSAAGQLVAACGDAQLSTFLRSSAKPFQALPLVMAGGIEHYHLSTQELALICASHSGTDEQVAMVSSLQAKIGIAENQLQCGIHPPHHLPTAQDLEKKGEAATPNRNNCSGKHTGMLACAKLRKWPPDSYLDLQHPLQQEIIALFAQIAELPAGELTLGTDGCSAPNWAAPLFNTALAYARLMDPAGLPPALQKACGQVRGAMLAHPDMVGGPERFDTALMGAAHGRLLSKGGAEGFQALGLRPGALAQGSPAMGIAIKISDGDARRWVSHAVALDVLRQLDALSADQMAQLSAFGPKRTITNWRGLEVGEGQPVFRLEKR